MRCVLTAAAVLAVALSVSRYQRPVAFAADAVTYHDMAAIPKAPYGPYPDARAVLTETSSVAIGTVPPHWRQAPHHHNQEQVTLGLGGSLGYSIAGTPHLLGSHGAGLPPPNVEHGMFNDTDEPALMAEYQPVLRREWLPPHPPVAPQPQSPVASPVRPEQQVTVDFGITSPGWRVEKNGARGKALTGATIRATFWDLSARGATLDIGGAGTARERVVFVLDGTLTTRVGTEQREIGHEMLIEVKPSAEHVILAASNANGALVAVFEVLGQ